MTASGHERRFKRKSRTSAFPPIADIIAGKYAAGTGNGQALAYVKFQPHS
jgi:hypothetical protein